VADKRDIEQYLREVARTLKKGGVAKLQLRSRGGEVRRWSWSYGASFSEEEIDELARSVGLKPLRTPYVEDIKHLWIIVTR
jgi:ubiquinone/menaquinone biosynthesis C-methylase UbiE